MSSDKAEAEATPPRPADKSKGPHPIDVREYDEKTSAWEQKSADWYHERSRDR